MQKFVICTAISIIRSIPTPEPINPIRSELQIIEAASFQDVPIKKLGEEGGVCRFIRTLALALAVIREYDPEEIPERGCF